MEQIAIIITKHIKISKHQILFHIWKMSTLPFYSKTNIGSRPSKRGKSSTLKFEDLRAIPFVGSWSQLSKMFLDFSDLAL